MRSANTLRVALLFFGIAVFLAGCGGKEADQKQSPRVIELAEIHELYTSARKANKRPPKSLADFQRNQAAFPFGYNALQRGEEVVIWGVDLKASDSGAILAYEKDAPQAGGFVVTADGTVKKMTAGEFQSTAKAKP